MRGAERAEFLLAIVVAILLVGSLLSRQYFRLPFEFVSLLIFVFVVLRVYDIVRSGGTIFEDYVSLSIIIVFGVINFLLGDRINSIIVAVIVFVLVYSVGLIPWVSDILKSRKVALFIASYIFFIITIVFLFSGVYFANADLFALHGEPTTLTFEDALYFSTISFTTVGYGDITPLDVNKFVAVIEAISGVVLNISFIGYILASHRFRRH